MVKNHRFTVNCLLLAIIFLASVIPVHDKNAWSPLLKQEFNLVYNVISNPGDIFSLLDFRTSFFLTACLAHFILILALYVKLEKFKIKYAIAGQLLLLISIGGFTAHYSSDPTQVITLGWSLPAIFVCLGLTFFISNFEKKSKTILDTFEMQDEQSSGKTMFRQ